MDTINYTFKLFTFLLGLFSFSVSLPQVNQKEERISAVQKKNKSSWFTSCKHFLIRHGVPGVLGGAALIAAHKAMVCNMTFLRLQCDIREEEKNFLKNSREYWLQHYCRDLLQDKYIPFEEFDVQDLQVRGVYEKYTGRPWTGTADLKKFIEKEAPGNLNQLEYDGFSYLVMAGGAATLWFVYKGVLFCVDKWQKKDIKQKKSKHATVKKVTSNCISMALAMTAIFYTLKAYVYCGAVLMDENAILFLENMYKKSYLKQMEQDVVFANRFNYDGLIKIEECRQKIKEDGARYGFDSYPERANLWISNRDWFVKIAGVAGLSWCAYKGAFFCWDTLFAKKKKRKKLKSLEVVKN